MTPASAGDADADADAVAVAGAVAIPPSPGGAELSFSVVFGWVCPVAVTDLQVGTATAGVSRINYDDVGNVLSTVDQLGAWTFFAYDDLDRVWATTDTERTPAATFTTYTVHNDAGDIVRVRMPANATGGQTHTTVFNQAGDLTESRDAGNPVSATDAMGWTTTSTYDALNQLRTVVEPVDASTSMTTSFGYAKAGVLTRMTDSRGNRVVYTYNPMNLRESVIEASTTAHPSTADREWKVSYDAGGLPVSETAPGGVVRTRTFDELGRLTAESGSGGGSVAAARSLTYDLAGRITTMSHPQGTQNVTYNDRNLVTGASGNGGTTTFTYDANGRMASRGDPGSFSSFGYNSRGDLNLVTGTATGGSRSLNYDSARQLTSVTYGTSTARTFGYDDLGRTTSDTLSGPGGTLRSQTYAYDLNDNRLSTVISPGTVASAGTQSYTYDRADRLTSWTDPTTAKVSAQARWYTPGTGTFISRDPMDVPFAGSVTVNRYLYAGVNPLAYNDLTGYAFRFSSFVPDLNRPGFGGDPPLIEPN